MARQRNGFTLPELMIALAVAAILISFTVPSMTRLLRDRQAGAAINDLAHAMRLARSEAVTRKLPTVICVSDDAGCAGDGDWGRGWTVFTDPDGDHDCQINGGGSCVGGGRILRRGDGTDAGFVLSATGNPGRYGFVVYAPSGFAAGYASTFTLCHVAGESEARGFTLNMSGRIAVKKPEELDCSK